jgi:hypothetical protein
MYQVLGAVFLKIQEMCKITPCRLVTTVYQSTRLNVSQQLSVHIQTFDGVKDNIFLFCSEVMQFVHGPRDEHFVCIGV